MDFRSAYQDFLYQQVQGASRARADRIQGGLGHSEETFLRKVWWPTFQSFDGLIPEYELKDFADALRFIDFAYLRNGVKVAIEIDGFGPHWRDITDQQFAHQQRRQNHLVMDRWMVIRFAYWDIEHNARTCQQTLQQLVGVLTSVPLGGMTDLDAREREIVRLAIRLNRPMAVRDVVEHTGFASRTVMRCLRRLVELGWLEPIGGKTRASRYQLCPTRVNVLL
ncbi:MAG: helix-turn-helix domain-containing protein [Alicyclobacillus sp.]|nr:helix-turn-helix domain-containing protein [Alicyclobacillus sp.]